MKKYIHIIIKGEISFNEYSGRSYTEPVSLELINEWGQKGYKFHSVLDRDENNEPTEIMMIREWSSN